MISRDGRQLGGLAGPLFLMLLSPAIADAQERFRPPSERWTLGVRVRNTDTGAQVIRVEPRSAAERVGLERGDTIITVDGQQVGLVNGRTEDVDAIIQQTIDRRRRVNLLILNGRNSQLLNVTVRREDGGFGGSGGSGGNHVDNSAKQIQQWYTQYLGRSASAPEMTNWLRELERGTSLSSIQNQILGGPEYFGRHGNDQARFIGALFRDLLKRDPVPPEGLNWLNALKRYGGDRVRLVEAFRAQFRV